ncbi:helix-turn-helix transcriptional regulator [Pannonibacter sp. P2PFMT1]|uniref:helix-turn-helix domain-containing protein n=1 Tax=Pannonibacter sp. P2PFMT1 TaxID=2003582 RepID=UPI00164865FB|nr:helix-turn-helix transcriptional regulator [Pannonibacter sp. P2PFMT1]
MTQEELADRAGISKKAVNDACEGAAIHMTTLFAISEALQWPAHDVAEMIEAKPETLAAHELREILARVDGTLVYKAGMLNTTDRTLRRWMNEDRPIPAGLKEELVALGWCE